ncbi:MAG: 3'-5' exonuclease [Candidatus Cryptobacteroides sp.]|nr:3'-5' exonuclease [Bacteroidales bacterium]MDD7119110.1 3'-5' exonuclease [Bacteroidales bacterium]MDY3227380.1 3'-5' exonuclease [Candidatus Cryptobacteroides sp.]MDY5442799.1 3'-5' exonuclease [Candidatus Cryptobacteroides sp.]
MNLNLERPLLFFDIESTGLNIATDCIAELSFVKIFPDGEQRIKTWKLCPWNYVARCQQPMNPSASEVNGLKDEDLAGCPKFHEVVDEVVEWLTDSDLAGFNSAKFDLPMLAEEIERVRLFLNRNIDLNLHEKKMVDVQTIYHAMEPRNLRAAYRFYCGGQDFENAHTAEADTIATYEVLKGQLDRYPDQLKNNVDFLANFAGRPKTVDYAGRLLFGKDGEAIISFGKHKGKTAREVYRTEPSYFAWIQNGEFTLDTKRQFEILRQQFEAEKKEAARQSRKPLEGKDFEDATQLLFQHFGGDRHQR